MATRAPSVVHVVTAVPTPYQPGSRSRFWLHENTHGIARRSARAVDALRDAGRLPMFSPAISPTGVAARNQSTNPSVPSSTRYAWRASADSSSITSW